jgi:hypothetical protein
MQKLRIVRDFGWEIAHEAVSRRPRISLDTIVAHTHMYTHAMKVRTQGSSQELVKSHSIRGTYQRLTEVASGFSLSQN